MIQSDPEDLVHFKLVMIALRLARQESLTQVEVGERMGIKQGRVSDIETNKWEDRLMVKTMMCYARAVGKRIRITVEDVP